jgi:hypothetical protein
MLEIETANVVIQADEAVFNASTLDIQATGKRPYHAQEIAAS